MTWYEDPYAFRAEDKIQLTTKFLHKIRYKSAALGIPLSSNERRICRWKDEYTGKRAFLIGNGPSLSALDLTRLKDEITFGVNAIYLNQDNMGFLPDHYIVEDNFVAEDRADEIVALNGPVKWAGNYLKYCLGAANMNWLNVLVDYRSYPGFPRFSKNAARAVWVGGSVSYIGMQLAYYMGVQTLYLIGFDHTYTIPETGIKSGNEIMSTGDDPNHFHADYFGKGYRWHDPRVDRMEKSYNRAHAQYSAASRQIVNATAGGKLEVFPRASYATLFESRTPSAQAS